MTADAALPVVKGAEPKPSPEGYSSEIKKASVCAPPRKLPFLWSEDSEEESSCAEE